MAWHGTLRWGLRWGNNNWSVFQKVWELTTSNKPGHTPCHNGDTSSMTFKGDTHTHANANKPTHIDPYAMYYILIYSYIFYIYMHIMHTCTASIILGPRQTSHLYLVTSFGLGQHAACGFALVWVGGGFCGLSCWIIWLKWLSSVASSRAFRSPWVFITWKKLPGSPAKHSMKHTFL